MQVTQTEKGKARVRKIDTMQAYHDKLQLLLDAMPRHSSAYSREQLIRILAEFKTIQSALHHTSDDYKNKTAVYVTEVRVIEQLLKTAGHNGQKRKAKDEAFNQAKRSMESLIVALAKLIRNMERT